MKYALLWLGLLCSGSLLAQDGSVLKFGKVSAADLSSVHYSIDTSAGAVVLSDIGSTQIKGNRKGGVSFEFKRFRRIHILNKNGYKHANASVLLYSNKAGEEQLVDLRAATYNLENGQVQVTRFEPSGGLFPVKLDRNWVAQKFTLPQVREGSVIEYEYTISSDFVFNLQPWAFQDEIPTLWSEYKVGIPQFLNYTLVGQGTQNFYLKEQKDKTGTYSLEMKKEAAGYGGNDIRGELVNITCGLTEFRWAMKDIPALRAEEYSTTIKNYISKLEFQFVGWQDPFIESKYMATWQEFAKELLKDENFGEEISKATSWLQGEIPGIVKDATGETAKARNIYAFIRDGFTCTGHNGFYAASSLKTVFEKKSGNVADLNLLLIAMLRVAGLKADPVLLSTRSHGVIYPKYPIHHRFNYIICKTFADGKEVMLDASISGLGFGKLSPESYNGLAKTIDETATDIVLKPGDILETETTNISLSADEKAGFSGKVNKLFSYYSSVDTRNHVRTSGKESFQKKIIAEIDHETVVSNLHIDSLENPDQPIRVRYDMQFATGGGDIIYINPMFNERYRTNPFKSTERLYPVEWPYKYNDSYTLYMTLPAGYKVDEMPQPVLIKMPGDLAVFEYKISQTGNAVRLAARLQINNTNFLASDYGDLREFFNQVVAKQNEQVVLKKTNL